MTASLARKNLTSLFLKNSSFVFESHFSLFRYCFSTSSENKQTASTAAVFDFLIQRHHFSLEAAKQISSALPHLKNPQETDSVLLFLKKLGFTNTQLERVVTCVPRVVYSTPANIGSKVKILHDFGFSASETAEIILTDPCILRYSLDRISSSLSILKSLLVSNERLSNVLRRHKRLFHCDYEKTLLPNIRVLNSCGIPMEQINGLMYTFPTFFIHSKPESTRKLVDKAAKMGVDRNSRMFIYAVRAVGSMTNEACELKFNFFHDLGFTKDDIMRMLRSSPVVLSASEQRIKRVKEVLLETGKYDMSCIVKYPASLMYSVEKRYKPRLKVLTILEKKNLLQKWPSLSTLCSMPDNDFVRKFIGPYVNEVGEALISKNVLDCKTRKKTLKDLSGFSR